MGIHVKTNSIWLHFGVLFCFVGFFYIHLNHIQIITQILYSIKVFAVIAITCFATDGPGLRGCVKLLWCLAKDAGDVQG